MSFSLTAAGTVSVRSFSCAGGVNGAGFGVASGGFVPVLSLFDSLGALLQGDIGSMHASSSCIGGADAVSGFCWDAGSTTGLVAGTYTLVLTQDENTATGPTLADGFLCTGTPDFTGWNYLGVTGQRFVQLGGEQRDGHWAVDISAATLVPVPEPESWALLRAGLPWCGGVRVGAAGVFCWPGRAWPPACRRKRPMRLRPPTPMSARRSPPVISAACRRLMSATARPPCCVSTRPHCRPAPVRPRSSGPT